MWSFDAQAGDGIVLRMGATNFNPIFDFSPRWRFGWLGWHGQWWFVDVDLMATATNSGTYIASSPATFVTPTVITAHLRQGTRSHCSFARGSGRADDERVET